MTLLNRYAGSEIREQKTLDTKVNTTGAFIADIDEHWITFGNIKCYDAQGNITESYRRIQMARDALRVDGRFQRYSFREAVGQLATQQHMLPSTALTCQFLVLLNEHKSTTECAHVLEQYKFGNFNGTHVQNTLISGAGKIIHYPFKDNEFAHKYFRYAHWREDVKQSHKHVQRREYSHGAHIFTYEPLRECQLHDALQNLTGLQDPLQLCNIEGFFTTPMEKVYYDFAKTPFSDTSLYAAQIGCKRTHFSLTATSLTAYSPTRAVRIP